MLCGLAEERVDHLFLYCEFAIALWEALDIELDLEGVGDGFPEWLFRRLKDVNQDVSFCKVVCAKWEIWRSPNRVVYDSPVPSFDSYVANIDINLSLLLKSMGARPREGVKGPIGKKREVSFCMGSLVDTGHVETVVVDGPWNKEMCVGAAAWSYGKFAWGCSRVMRYHLQVWRDWQFLGP